MILEMLSTLAAGLFAGAALYINLVEHPARIGCGTVLAVTEFAPSYRRAAIMQGVLAALGFLIATSAWLTGASLWWLIGGIILGAVIPFTLFVIFPTNKQLLDHSLDKKSAHARKLLVRWGRLHAARSILSLISFLIFILLLGRSALK
jgi:putative Ca2+/H+ antiporter (TMEM165/GDT1 family)